MATTRAQVVILLICGLPLAACPGERRRSLGSTCGDDAQCQSSFCYEEVCLDPAADDDGDGIINELEKPIGTSAFDPDTDGDGLDDGFEVAGAPGAPPDFDGDGRIDALEHNFADSDSDCLTDYQDPDDGQVAADVAKLANYGCCCAGPCDQLGLDVSATCVEVDGVKQIQCDPEEPDLDADGVPDPCDEQVGGGGGDCGGLCFDEEIVLWVCDLACAAMAEGCPTDAALFPTAAVADAACVEQCVERALEQGAWLASFMCLRVTCDAEQCAPGGEPLVILEPCVTGCAALDACGALSLVGLDDGQADLCAAFCTASSVTDEGFATTRECLATAATADACDPTALLNCLDPGVACHQLCQPLDREEGACHSGTGFAQTLGDADHCLEQCLELPNHDALGLWGCAAVHGCGALPNACSTSSATSPACSDACAKLYETCGDEWAWLSPQACAAYCAGVETALDGPISEDALGCLFDAGCPGDAGGQEATFLGCTIPLDQACLARCGDLFTSCDGAAPPLWQDVSECAWACTLGQHEEPKLWAAIGACLDQATACDSALACVPAAPDGLCEGYCDAKAFCEPDRAACMTECADFIAEHATGPAIKTCVTLVPCSDFVSDCEGQLNLPVSDACVAACAGTDTCSAYFGQLCPLACEGVLTAMAAFGDGTPSAQCVVDALGPACDAEAASMACSAFAMR